MGLNLTLNTGNDKPAARSSVQPDDFELRQALEGVKSRGSFVASRP